MILCLKKPTGCPALEHSGRVCIHALDDQIQRLYAVLPHHRPRLQADFLAFTYTRQLKSGEQGAQLE
jgi:hypothetical protein